MLIAFISLILDGLGDGCRRSRRDADTEVGNRGFCVRFSTSRVLKDPSDPATNAIFF